MAVAAHRARWSSPSMPGGLTSDRARRRRSGVLAALDRPRCRRLVRLRRRTPTRPATSARDDGLALCFRHATGCRSVWRSSARRWWRWSCHRTGRKRCSRARLCDVCAGWRPPAGHLWPAQPHPSRRATSIPSRWSPGGATRSALQLNDVGARVPGRPPHPPRALDRLLADRLAVARARRRSRCHRRQPACAAGPPRAARGRRAAPFAEPESAPPDAVTTCARAGFERTLRRTTSATDTMTLHLIADFGRQRIDAHGLELEGIARKIYRIDERRPAFGRRTRSTGRPRRWRAATGGSASRRRTRLAADPRRIPDRRRRSRRYEGGSEPRSFAPQLAR